MGYVLDNTTIKSPNSLDVSNSTQYAQQRVFSGGIARDYFGNNKRVWKLSYDTVQKTYFDVIDSIYQAYLSTGTPVSFEITETNNTVAETTVHVDLQQRSFTVGGEDYLSSFTLILTEN